MAKIVLGMAVPHSGMLNKPSSTWLEDGDRDKQKSELWFRNQTYTYPELEALRSDEGFAGLLAPEEMAARAAKCTAAQDEMRKAYEAADVDVAIVIGKDQKEIFVDHTPSIAVYTGEEIHNGPPQRTVWGPDHAVVHPGYPELARKIITNAEEDGFDLTDIFNWPPHRWLDGANIVPHAFGYVYHHIMSNKAPRNVPILLNTFYPPTQPSMARSIAFGRSLHRTITEWEEDVRVAIIASGGMSHFVCDEQFDHSIIEMMQAGDLDALAGVDDRSYQSGTSEIKLYASVMVSMQAVGAGMNLVDYVPCYRTAAGTGEGMAFMYWS